MGDKIDFKVKFVNYAMHGEKEIAEQIEQYCIQDEQNDKYLTYLECFLEDGDTGNSCLSATGVDIGKLDKCISETDAEYGISENFADKTTWTSGRFPFFAIYDEECKEYGVAGSPTLIINGKKLSVARSSTSLLEAIFSSFTEAPVECSEELSSESTSPGFGY